MRLICSQTCVTLAILAALSSPAAQSQTLNITPAPPPRPLPLLKAPAPIPEPTTPAARLFHDPSSGVSFRIPAAWSLTRKDGEVSTFALDARTAPHTARLRAVANITFNPHPYST